MADVICLWLTSFDEIDAIGVFDAIEFGGALGACFSLLAGVLDQVAAQNAFSEVTFIYWLA